MEYMGLTEFIKYGTPSLLLALIILNVYQAAVIRQLQQGLKDLKDSITWGDTCTERHEYIDKRLDALEATVYHGKR